MKLYQPPARSLRPGILGLLLAGTVSFAATVAPPAANAPTAHTLSPADIDAIWRRSVAKLAGKRMGTFYRLRRERR